LAIWSVVTLSIRWPGQ